MKKYIFKIPSQRVLEFDSKNKRIFIQGALKKINRSESMAPVA